MLCDAVTASLVEGRPLSPIEAEHANVCSSCARLVGAIRSGAPSPAEAATAPPPTATLSSRHRAAQARGAGAVLLAAGLLAALGAAFLPDAASPPSTPLIATVDEGVEPTAPVTGADAGLLALVSGLDHLEAEPTDLPGADLVDMLDPFGQEPLYNPLNPRSTEGEL